MHGNTGTRKPLLVAMIFVATNVLFATTNEAEAQEAITVRPTPIVMIPRGEEAAPMKSLQALRAARAHASTAQDIATDRVVGWRSLPEMPDYKILLNADRPFQGSLSVGSVGRGSLKGAATLPFEGPHHSVIERHRKHGTAFGTDELVATILDAAAHVDAAEDGAPLRIGNLSRKNGGDIRWSRSHNSGRDADLAFYVERVENGASVPAPDLLQFDDAGVPIGHPELRFDVARNWLLVRGLLLQKNADIQYIFISNGLKALLLDHARTSGEPASLLVQAENVLRQPTDALPHDDHFHLRIVCPGEDRLRGCIESGPTWEWADYHHTELLAQALSLKDALNDDDVSVRIAALEMLGEMRHPYADEVALIWGVKNDSLEVRELAIKTASRAWPWSATSLVMAEKLIESRDSTLSERAYAYSILRRSREPMAHRYAMHRLELDEVSAEERVYAARALGHMMESRAVPFLLSQLEKQPPKVRAELAAVLRRVTNRSTEVDWSIADPTTTKKTLASWKKWWQKHQDLPRQRWVLQGLADQGIRVQDLDARAIDAMIPALRTAPDHVLYNVNFALREMTGRWSPLESLNGRALHKSWSRWWKRNRERMMAQEREKAL